MLSLKLRAILFPFQMEPRREELLHELGVSVRCVVSVVRFGLLTHHADQRPAIRSSC
jgi:hypothetical protein